MSERPHYAPKTEFVYLVSVYGEWPVSAIADDHSSTPNRIEDEVNRRRESGNGPVRVWRARIDDLIELELIPARTVGPELKVKTP